VIEQIGDGAIEIAVSVPLVLEYEAVLLRHLSPTQKRADVATFVDFLCRIAHPQEVFYLWRPLSPDANDDMVAEVAVAGSADVIVTHNARDFAAVRRFGIDVTSPGESLLTLSRKK